MNLGQKIKQHKIKRNNHQLNSNQNHKMPSYLYPNSTQDYQGKQNQRMFCKNHMHYKPSYQTFCILFINFVLIILLLAYMVDSQGFEVAFFSLSSYPQNVHLQVKRICLTVSLLFSDQVVSDSATPWTVACQALLSMEFSRQEYWSG